MYLEGLFLRENSGHIISVILNNVCPFMFTGKCVKEHLYVLNIIILGLALCTA